MTDLEHLRTLYRAAVEAMRRVDLAQEQARMAVERATFAAKEAIAAYHCALAEAHIADRVPSGYSIDVLGDGAVKPVEDCAKDISR